MYEAQVREDYRKLYSAAYDMLTKKEAEESTNAESQPDN